MNTSNSGQTSNLTLCLSKKWIYTIFGIVLTGGMALEVVLPMRADAQRVGKLRFESDKCTMSLDRVRGVFNFVNPCIRHDRCYFDVRRRSQGQQGFERCDQQFLGNLRRACQRQHRRLSPLRVQCYQAAGTYYTAVRALTRTGTRRLTP